MASRAPSAPDTAGTARGRRRSPTETRARGRRRSAREAVPPTTSATRRRTQRNVPAGPGRARRRRVAGHRPGGHARRSPLPREPCLRRELPAVEILDLDEVDGRLIAGLPADIANGRRTAADQHRLAWLGESRSHKGHRASLPSLLNWLVIDGEVAHASRSTDMASSAFSRGQRREGRLIMHERANGRPTG